MQFIGNISEEGVKEAMEKNKEIKKAQEELEYLSGDEEARRIAELREKAIRDEITNLEGARAEGELIGEARGKAEGEIIGEERGRKIGEIKGMKKEKTEIAKKMKEENIPMKQIEKITGLTKEEIENL